MSGLYRVPLVEGCKLVKQRLRRTNLNVGFLEIVKYPQCVSNIVVVPEEEDKIRVCVDFRNLNRTSPKDNFFSITHRYVS
jgi:hypothetical protein